MRLRWQDSASWVHSFRFGCPGQPPRERGLPSRRHSILRERHGHSAPALAVLSTSAEMGTMVVGDCNDDNLANAADFIVLRNTYGRGSGDPGYDDRAEFTGDQLVNIQDFNLLRRNFGAGGAPPISPGEGKARHEG